MYVNIGGDVVVRSSEIVAIFSASIGEQSAVSQQFLHYAENNQLLMRVSDEPVKSIVVVGNKVYCSPISSNTLKQRSNQFYKNEIFA